MNSSTIPQVTLDDVPEIADNCKIIAARYDQIMSHRHRSGTEPEKKAIEKILTWTVDEAVKTVSQLGAIIHTIQASVDAHRRKLPNISYFEWHRSLQNALGDPLGPESRATREGTLIGDVPRLADRLRAVALRYEEFERRPPVRGDDIMESYDRVNAILMECQRVKKYLVSAMEDVCFSLLGDHAEPDNSSLVDSCSSEESSGSEGQVVMTEKQKEGDKGDSDVEATNKS